MKKIEKALLVIRALMYLAVFLFVGPNLVALAIAIGISALIRVCFAMANRSKSVQQESLDNAGFTGLSLNEPARPARK
jgi:hypothetical protein